MASAPRKHLYDSFLRKVPKQSRSRAAVEAILVAATERLFRDGDEDPVLERVAERAGVGIGSLYDYFADREGLLAGLVAKLTEDNLRSFEAMLEETARLPFEPAVERLVDHVLETYLAKPNVGRFALRMAHQWRLMPLLAETQTIFAASLATALEARSDLPRRDYSVTAYVLVQSAMGLVHTLLWQEAPPFARAALRAELCTVVVRALRG